MSSAATLLQAAVQAPQYKGEACGTERVSCDKLLKEYSCGMTSLLVLLDQACR